MALGLEENKFSGSSHPLALRTHLLLNSLLVAPTPTPRPHYMHNSGPREKLELNQRIQYRYITCMPSLPCRLLILIGQTNSISFFQYV